MCASVFDIIKSKKSKYPFWRRIAVYNTHECNVAMHSQAFAETFRIPEHLISFCIILRYFFNTTKMN